MSGIDYKSLTVHQLRTELRRKGFKSSGRKSVLVNRILSRMPVVNGDLKHKQQKTNGISLKKEERDGEDVRKYVEFKRKIKLEREDLVLWKQPTTTVIYCTKELVTLAYTFLKGMLHHLKMVAASVLVTSLVYAISSMAGPHQQVLSQIYERGLWCLYWLGLGVLSSVGLGTGLHTFLLYLGPHIASVTLAAYECEALNFPEPPYPDQIICPEILDPAWRTSLLNIMHKVKVEAMMWGAGTALGELPPYFMARAARLSGQEEEDEDDEWKEVEELQKKKESHAPMSAAEKAKLFIENIVKRVGFFGILACASIPNPLFDLAGITCGHFLIPFWTFFGATLLGKAGIKMMIQVLFVIVAFNEVLIEKALEYVSFVPLVGKHLQAPVTQFLENQKKRLHSKSVTNHNSKIAKLFEAFVIAMVGYFCISIVNSMAQNHHKRLHKEQLHTMKREIKCD